MNTATKASFEGVSLRGCIAYAIMCAERVALSTKPDAQWGWIFDEFWKITNVVNWEDWVDRVVDLIPGFIDELDEYDPAEFDWIDESQFQTLKELYANMPASFETALHGAFDIEEHYAYSSVTDGGLVARTFLSEILDALKNENIAEPDATLVAFSKLNGNGFGEPFDAAALRTI